MRTEVEAAINFFAEKFFSDSRQERVGDEVITEIKNSLQELFCLHYDNHWYEDKPLKGSAYRCIQIIANKRHIHPVLLKVFSQYNFTVKDLLLTFGKGISIWVDPGDVSCQIGNGAIFPIYRRMVSEKKRDDRPRSTSPVSCEFPPLESRPRSVSPSSVESSSSSLSTASDCSSSSDVTPLMKVTLNPNAAEFDFKPTKKSQEVACPWDFGGQYSTKRKYQPIWQDDEVYNKYHWSRSNNSNTKKKDDDFTAHQRLQEVF